MNFKGVLHLVASDAKISWGKKKIVHCATREDFF